MYVGGMQVGEEEIVSVLAHEARRGLVCGWRGRGVDIAKAAPLFQPTTDASDDGHSKNIKKSFHTRRMLILHFILVDAASFSVWSPLQYKRMIHNVD